MDFQEFSRWCRQIVGHSEQFHGVLYRQLMTTGSFDPASLPLWQDVEVRRPGTIQSLKDAANLFRESALPRILRTDCVEDPVEGTTTKFLLQLADQRQIEAVHIPMKGGTRYTVCVSSQVGCRMGCRFCRTATMGLVRQLTVHEIVGQVIAVAHYIGKMPGNIVFMGMGEPLDNVEAVGKAVRVLTESRGMSFTHHRITVSTVGRADIIPKLPQFGLGRVNLAVSITIADDEKRSNLIPINRAFDLQTLKESLQQLAATMSPSRHFLISYVLLAGVNDALEDARRLIAWCRDLPVMVNLIPFNAIPGSSLQRPSEAQVYLFRDTLLAAGIAVRLRVTRGDDVLAACGQLAV